MKFNVLKKAKEINAYAKLYDFSTKICPNFIDQDQVC